MKRLSVISTIIMLLCGCASYTMEEVLLERSDISLTWRGELQVSYNPESCQIGFNDSRLEYRVYDDRLSEWFTVRFSEMPSTEGQTLYADVEWTGKTGTKTFKRLGFQIAQTDEQGLLWLWNSKNSIGIIIKDIR